MTYCRFIPLAAALALSAGGALAADVTSPAGSVSQPASTAAPGQIVVQEKPLIVIRFSQRRVYFDRALRQAVISAEKARAGVVYNVVSYMPAGQDNHQNAMISQDSMSHQQEVINALQSFGIPPSRIRASMGSDVVQSPEVRVYVN